MIGPRIAQAFRSTAKMAKSLDQCSISHLYRAGVLEKGTIESVFKPDQSLNDRVYILEADITKLKVDAIVNAAKRSLSGGGGVDGAIHSAAGGGLAEECLKLPVVREGSSTRCETGDAKITKAYNLPCKNVIHAVGPNIAEGEDMLKNEELLRSCYYNSLKLAVENDLESIAFPCISTAIFSYPPEEACRVALGAVRYFLENKPNKLKKVVFCCFSLTPRDFKLYTKYAQ